MVEIAQNDDVKVETVEQAIQYISDRFITEMLNNNSARTNIQDLFVYWLSGLSLHTYYMTDDIIKYLNSIGLYGKNEKQEREKAADLYHYLIFREVKDHLFKTI